MISRILLEIHDSIVHPPRHDESTVVYGEQLYSDHTTEACGSFFYRSSYSVLLLSSREGNVL